MCLEPSSRCWRLPTVHSPFLAKSSRSRAKDFHPCDDMQAQPHLAGNEAARIATLLISKGMRIVNSISEVSY